MPQKDDFLTRLQELTRSAIAEAQQQAAAGRPEDALEHLRAAQQRVIGIDAALLARLSYRDLLSLLEPTGNPNIETCLQCAELLAAENDLLEASGTSDPEQARKALELLLHALQHEPEFAPHYAGRLKTLTERVDDVTAATAARLTEAFKRSGRFDEAENWLYHWAEVEPQTARRYGEGFYKALSGLDDAALEAGGLPRDELEEGRRALLSPAL